MLLISYARGSDEPANLGFLKTTGLLFPVLEAALVIILFVVASMTSGSGAYAAAASVANMLTGSYAPAFWIGFVVIGIAIPLVLEFLHRKSSATEGGAFNAQAVVGEACVLVGAFMLRYLMIMAAVPIFLQ